MKKFIFLSLLIYVGAYSEGVKLEDSVITSKISSTGFETTILDEPTNVAVITKDQIEEKNYKNVEDILKDNPNVNIVSTRNGPVIDMRGSGENAVNNVKVLVDGIAMNPLTSFSKALSINSIPVETIERIEIAPGGGAVLYGNGVSGGVINIITKDAPDNKTYVETMFSSYNTKQWATGGNYRITDDLDVGIFYSGENGNGYRKETKLSNDFIGGNLTYRLSEEHKFRFEASKFKEDEKRTDSATKIVMESDRRAAGVTLTDSKFTRDSYSGKYEYTPSNNFSLTTTIYNHIIKNDSTETNRKTSAVTDTDSKENTKGLLLKTVTNYDSGSIIVGFDALDSKFDQTSISKSSDNLSDYRKESFSPYILNKYNLTENFEFLLGYRHEWDKYKVKTQDSATYFDKNITDDNKAYEGVLSYKYRDTGNVFFRYEKGYVSPTPGQMSDKIDGLYVYNGLTAETSDTYEIGIKDYINYNTFTTLSLFIIDKKNEISRTKDGNDTYYSNLAETKRKGIEFNLENYIGNLTLTSGFTYIDAENTKGPSKGERIADVPRFKGNIGANYKFTNYLDGTITYRYVSNRFSKGIITDPYQVTDIAARYKVTDYLTFKVGVNNIFNESYYTVEHSTTANPAPKRNYYAGAKLTF